VSVRPSEIPPPGVLPALRLPELELPPYRYVPGRHPHPLKDTTGHMADCPPTPTWGPDQPWEEDLGYVRGCDLFDHRYLWEAHEAWEGVWHQVPVDSSYRYLLQGLIQAAAGVLKRHVQHTAGAARLHARSREKLLRVLEAEGPRFKGMDLPELVTRLDAVHSGGCWPILPMSLP